jgi:hypothetical protein
MKRYFAGQSDHGSKSSHGFANDWTVYAFSSKSARDSFVEKSDNLSCKAIPFKKVTAHAANWSLTRNEYNKPKPFSAEFWAIVPFEAWNDQGIDGCIGVVDVCFDGHPYYRDSTPLYK